MLLIIYLIVCYIGILPYIKDAVSWRHRSDKEFVAALLFICVPFVFPFYLFGTIFMAIGRMICKIVGE